MNQVAIHNYKTVLVTCCIFFFTKVVLSFRITAHYINLLCKQHACVHIYYIYIYIIVSIIDFYKEYRYIIKFLLIEKIIIV